MSFKSQFLPGGLVLAITTALILPEPGVVVKSWNLVSESVMLIFVINGFQSRLNFKDANTKFFKAFGVLVLSSLFLSPFLGKFVAQGLSLPMDLALGLMVMSAMPTTLSSGMVIADVAGGSAVWSLMLTMGLNIVGIFTIPFVLALTLAECDIRLSPWPLLLKLFEMVMLPYLFGMGLKKFFQLSAYKNVISYIPSVCVIFVVWVSLSFSAEKLLQMPITLMLWSFVAALLVHVGLFIFHYFLARTFILSEANLKSFVIVGSQKTLPIALSVLAVLGLPNSGAAIMICLVFHFSQLMLDSFIAARWARLA